METYFSILLYLGLVITVLNVIGIVLFGRGYIKTADTVAMLITILMLLFGLLLFPIVLITLSIIAMIGFIIEIIGASMKGV